MDAKNNSLWPVIRDTPVPAGAVHVWWLLQAGFVIKSPGGYTVCIDAYLTDSVKTSYGISRGYPAPLSPEESEFDAVLATHSLTITKTLRRLFHFQNMQKLGT